MAGIEHGQQRRRIVQALGAAGALGALGAAAPGLAQPSGKIKVGFMLPYTGTYAALGHAIENGFKLYVQEQGGKLGGREIEYFKVDDESEPSKATDNVNKLIKRDNVDVLVGTVHSGVALAMAKAAKDNNTLLIIPNAGADAITGPMCAPNILRSSFSNWQPGYAMGIVAAQKGVKTRDDDHLEVRGRRASRSRASTEAFEKGGGKVVKELYAAVPERRVPGAADRDRGAEARRASTPSSPAAARSSSSRTTPPRASTRRSRSTARASSPTARSRRRALRRRAC